MKIKISIAFLFILFVTTASFAQEQMMMMHGRSKTDPLKVGEIAPDFSLVDDSGRTVTLSSLKGTTVLVFYRAYWCPYCISQLAALRSLKHHGDKFNIVAISPDPINRLQETKTKVAKDGKGQIAFPLLSDPGSKTVDAYGVYDPTYAGQKVDGIPHPSIFILGKDRRVLWANVALDYKKRPTNEDIRAALAMAN